MFNIKVPFLIATHVKSLTSTSALKTKSKAAPIGLISKYLQYHDGGGVKKVNGIAAAAVSATGATLTLDPTLHDGLIVAYNRAAGGTVTLPAASGSGALYRIAIGTTLTSGSMIFQVANANDYMRGQVSTSGSSGITVGLTANTGTVSTESDTVTWNRTTTGLGTQGDYIEFIDFIANVWLVYAEYSTAGQAAATPFSAAV